MDKLESSNKTFQFALDLDEQELISGGELEQKASNAINNNNLDLLDNILKYSISGFNKDNPTKNHNNFLDLRRIRNLLTSAKKFDNKEAAISLLAYREVCYPKSKKENVGHLVQSFNGLFNTAADTSSIVNDYI